MQSHAAEGLCPPEVVIDEDMFSKHVHLYTNDGLRCEFGYEVVLFRVAAGHITG
jgi:hypothetical protein